ncbi:TetR/AcrR family transcriptional regulator [Cryobacterium breve]|uniref:TetR/AcrR family transcriptional regulator n=1 Tax=Cryobacterium breve TaxID=1259258 RepID=A0ABY7N9Q9_9MICO|nr:MULTISPECIES: TetR/AcrR family transcriptional regulator [Cryobacterium]MDY7542333.1 TetR/AcrR family transcriptional regulator [Cryobacterium sp. 5B3]MEB0000347.1 TetR/AcrR family transcriptional regulator [Cryobacterium sp. RTS3]MEB0267781.1 TetR/AcrR family transcriptional regulator [Cryobacterium sp. 10I5]MEB0275922.1 TetR/AcrR family transcriptional regulator [Cryobacterium sp. 5B3]WBM79200.1 TetR/AcrR family transcriptional regulator [Cryobacterium breve]
MAQVTGTKRLIFDAALALAAERGISGTTMDDVAVRAGVAKGSLYYNFASKDKIFEGVLSEGMAALTEALRSARTGLHGWAAIEALVTTLLCRIAGNTALAKVMAGDIFRTDRAWQETSFAFRHQALAEFAAAIEEAVPTEAGAAGVTGLMASSVFGATLMAGLEWLIFEPDRPQPEVVAAVLATFSGRLNPTPGIR